MLYIKQCRILNQYENKYTDSTFSTQCKRSTYGNQQEVIRHSAFGTVGEFREVLESKLNNLAGRLARICDKNVILKTATALRKNVGDQDIQNLRDITDPMTLAERMYREVNQGEEMSPELRALLSDIIREAEGTQEISGTKTAGK